jgi:hypothetical protein
MNEEQLSEAVHDSLADVPVGPPPLDRMHRTATRVRRARRATASVVAATVVVVAGIAAWSGLGDEPDSDISPVAPTEDAGLPAGSQWVGRGHVVVAVPESWVHVPERVSADCGAGSDVVVYNAPDCGKSNRDAVHLFEGRPADLQGWEEVEIAGEHAYRIDIRPSHTQIRDGEPTVWTGSIFLPGEQVIVSGISSRSASALARLLATVDVNPDLVAVPDFREHAGAPDPSVSYREALMEQGFAVEVVRAGVGPAGRVLGVDPEPGLAVPVGSVVTVQVSRGRDG